MDDAYAINVAKTEFREAYNTGDADRLLAILDDDIIDYPDGRQLRGSYKTESVALKPTSLQPKIW